MQLNLSLPPVTEATRYATSETIAGAIENRLVSIAQLLGSLKRSLEDLGDQVQLNSTNASILSRLYSLEHYLAVELSKLTVTVPRQFGMRSVEGITLRSNVLDLFLESLSKTSTPTRQTPWATEPQSSSPCTSWEEMAQELLHHEPSAPTLAPPPQPEVASKLDPEVVDCPNTEKS